MLLWNHEGEYLTRLVVRVLNPVESQCKLILRIKSIGVNSPQRWRSPSDSSIFVNENIHSIPSEKSLCMSEILLYFSNGVALGQIQGIIRYVSSVTPHE